VSDRVSRTVSAEDLANAKTDLTVINAQLSNLRLRVQRGQLVDRTRFEATATAACHRVRDQFVNAPARQAAVIASDYELEPGRVHVGLERVLRKIFNDIADRPT
jgi:hypothetical protein